MNVQVSARIDEEIKNEAEKAFREYGQDTSSIIRSLMTITAKTHKLPFVIGGSENAKSDAKYNLREIIQKNVESGKANVIDLIPNAKGGYTLPKGVMDRKEFEAWSI